MYEYTKQETGSGAINEPIRTNSPQRGSIRRVSTKGEP